LAKHLKLTIKNTQIAEAVNLGGLKKKLAKSKESEEPVKTSPKVAGKAKKEEIDEVSKALTEEPSPRIRARSKSVFAESPGGKTPPSAKSSDETVQEISEIEPQEKPESLPNAHKTPEELRREIFGEISEEPTASVSAKKLFSENFVEEESAPKTKPQPEPEISKIQAPIPPKPIEKAPTPKVVEEKPPVEVKKAAPMLVNPPERVKLGPTGRHISDLLPKRPPPRTEPAKSPAAPQARSETKKETPADTSEAGKAKARKGAEEVVDTRKGKAPFGKEFRDVKPTRKGPDRGFDARDRQGLRSSDDDQRWRKKRSKGSHYQQEDLTIRPTSLKIRVPITIKDLASEMKLKSSELISKLFLQGIVVTLNDFLEDETTIQLLGQEFGCEIALDTTEEARIRITDETVNEEIKKSPQDDLIIRPPVVAFMGHVDHGKTSLIDAIRKSNRVSGEAGAITQHIGAFRCSTPVGDITILDTPGHEAFSAMRARGADVTDIVVLVVAGDEGIRQQTLEAIEHARTAGVIIVVAINKSDKPNFNVENVYRQLADNNLLPESWGGQTITVSCSAATGQGIKELLEMLALQAEVLELKANPKMRARGTVLESELHKGMGAVATVLVQNGTLHIGDSLVFEQSWGHVKTMKDEFGRDLKEAPPCTPVAITGLSIVPEAGQEFIVVKNEREAREIGEARVLQGRRQTSLIQKKPLTLESITLQATPTTKKTLNVILRADVQGSLEAIRTALEKIESTKADLNVIFAGVGEVSESDVQLAATSKGVIIGFHTRIESHAESLVKQFKIKVRLHDIIYHAIDDAKEIMTGMLDKIAQETERGKAEIKAIFKSSQVGQIAGCQVIEGTIQRNYQIRVMRNKELVGKASIASLKRVKEDVREVSKGQECGIALNKFPDIQVGDILEAYEVTYITQEL
jgi:translation initiation factor IF-2